MTLLNQQKKLLKKIKCFKLCSFTLLAFQATMSASIFLLFFLLFTKTGQRRRIRKRIKQSVWRPDDKLLFPFIFQQLKPKRIITLQLHTKSKNGRCKKKQQQRRKKTPPDRQMVCVNTHTPNCRCALKSAPFFHLHQVQWDVCGRHTQTQAGSR